MTADDRQPGGNGAGSTVDGIHVIAGKEAWEEWAYDHDALGRSRLQSAFYAGWVACTDDLRAALETAQSEIERLNAEGEHTVAIANFAIRDLAQSRATEVELRRQRDGYFAALNSIAASYCESGRATYHSHIAKAALDAAEQPARAQDGPQQPAEETR